MEKRYTGLRLAGTIYKVLGIIFGVLTILAVVGICLSAVLGGAAMNNVARDMGGSATMLGSLGGVVGGIIFSILALIYGGAISIGLYAFGELVFLLVSLEENTRATAMLLQRREIPPAAGGAQG
jgi:hypothetical protein